jgi:hypothetical protein
VPRSTNQPPVVYAPLGRSKPRGQPCPNAGTPSARHLGLAQLLPGPSNRVTPQPALRECPYDGIRARQRCCKLGVPGAWRHVPVCRILPRFAALRKTANFITVYGLMDYDKKPVPAHDRTSVVRVHPPLFGQVGLGQLLTAGPFRAPTGRSPSRWIGVVVSTLHPAPNGTWRGVHPRPRQNRQRRFLAAQDPQQPRGAGQR